MPHKLEAELQLLHLMSQGRELKLCSQSQSSKEISKFKQNVSVFSPTGAFMGENKCFCLSCFPLAFEGRVSSQSSSPGWLSWENNLIFFSPSFLLPLFENGIPWNKAFQENLRGRGRERLILNLLWKTQILKYWFLIVLSSISGFLSRTSNRMALPFAPLRWSLD